MIKPIPQTSKDLYHDIQCVGCFFRSSQAIAEMEAGKTLSPDQINNMWTWAIKAGYIDEYNRMKASAPIANKTLEVLGVKDKKFIEIATSKNGIATFYKSITKDMQKPKYFIRKIHNQYNGTHFLVVDEKGITIFDPDVSIKEVREYYTILYYVKEV
ncbi:MAG: hypothetical protein ACTTJ6_01940 [Treponema sp.]